jgi:HEAT repeat protein
MFKALKTWKFSSALKARGNAQEAYAAVMELGQLGTDDAVDLLLGVLSRHDGVARAAARELGRLANPRSFKPLADLLGNREVHESVAEALIRIGGKAIDVLAQTLHSEDAVARRTAARVLGEIRDARAVEPLVEVLQGDPDCTVRTAAAHALGQIKDKRAIWALVNTLKLRDEPDPEFQRQIEELRNAAQLAMRRIGDPLAVAKAGGAATGEPEEIPGAEGEAPELPMHPRLMSGVAALSEADLIAIVKELISASEEISWAKLENREPMLAAYFKDYEQRRQTAEAAGKELARRGGPELLQTILERDLNNHTAIQNWWSHLELPSR